jgi:quercetin dioxygenase-like cupin family protein
MIRYRALMLWLIPLIGVTTIAGAVGGEGAGPAAGTSPTYSFATNGVWESVKNRSGTTWKLLLDESVVGGKEIEMAELTMPAGTTVPSHTHGRLEVIYVLSGVYGHEVNGKLYLLKPGMVGIVRPGDHVRHLVPKAADATVLIIWAPAGEAAGIVPHGVAAQPVPQAQSLDP